MATKQIGKQFIIGIQFLLLMFLLIGCNPEQQGPSSAIQSGEVGPGTEALTDITACGSSLGIGSWPGIYAEQTGLFQEYGLRVDMHNMSSGTSAVTALLAGDVDICHIAGSAVVNAALAVDDPVIIAGLINRQPYSLVVAPDIEQPDDLRGKVLAVSSPGSSSDTMLRKGLTALGLDPESDVTIVSAGRQAERRAALESGQVAGSLFTLSELDNATNAGYHVLLDMNDLNFPFQHTAVVTTRSFLEDNQETTTNFLKALLAARAAMVMDPLGGPDIIADGLLIDGEQERANIHNIYALVTEEYHVRDPIPTREGLAELLAAARQENPNARDITADDMIDLTIVQELQDSGFIDALYEEPDQE